MARFPIRNMPFIEGGGALIVGRETAEIGNNVAYYTPLENGSVRSSTNFNWWLGVGSEIPLSESIQLDFMVKYIRTQFSDYIAGIKDYSGVQITVGIGYFKLHKKK